MFFTTKETEAEHDIYEVVIYLKAFNGFLEVMLGFFVLIFHNQIIRYIFQFLKQEFLEDPKDLIATILKNALPVIHPHTYLYIGIYLLVHGIVKLVLIISLIQEKIWSYPISAVAFSIFALYEGYRTIMSHSIALLVFTVFDAILVLLILREYQTALQKLAHIRESSEIVNQN